MRQPRPSRAVELGVEVAAVAVDAGGAAPGGAVPSNPSAP